MRFEMVHSNSKNPKPRVRQSQVCYLPLTHSSALKITFRDDELAEFNWMWMSEPDGLRIKIATRDGIRLYIHNKHRIIENLKTAYNFFFLIA